MEENPELVQAARRGSAIVDPETGLPQADRNGSLGEKDGMRKSSLVAGEGRRPSLVTSEQEGRKASLVPRK